MSTQEAVEREELLRKLMAAMNSPSSTVSNEEIRKILSITQSAASGCPKEESDTNSEDDERSNTDDNENVEESSGPSSAFDEIKNYPRRPGADDMGREYELKITALVAIRLAAMKDTKEMWIGSNVDTIGDLDDIVLFKQTPEGDYFAYMVQLKHQEKPENITQRELHPTTPSKKVGKKSKEAFSLAKYCKSFVNLREKINNPADDEWKIFEYLRKAKKIMFVLYTNRGVNQCDFLKNIESDMLSLLYTKPYQNNVYTFNHQKLPYDSDFLQQLILITNQAHLNETDKLIKKELKTILSASGVINVDIKKTAEKFVAFIRGWAKGIESKKNLKIFYTLYKSDLLNKLVDILLDPYKLNFSKEQFFSCASTESKIWKQIINRNITVVDSNTSVLRFLKSFIGYEISQHCNEPKNTWLDHLSKSALTALSQKFPDFNTKTVANQEEITLFDIYQCLWFNNKLPLLLKIEKPEDYRNIINILKISDKTSTVIITKSENLELQKMKNSKQLFALHDLNQEDREIILNRYIQLQGRSSEVLNNLVHDSMYKCIKCKDIINILTQNFSIGSACNYSSYFIPRSISKVFLPRNTLFEIPGELFLIENFNSTGERLCNIISSKREIKRTEKKPVHRLVYYDEQHFEWIESFGSTANIKKFRDNQLYKMKHMQYEKSKHSFDIENLWVSTEDTYKRQYFWNRTIVVSANPGAGKSILLDLIARQAPLDVWVLKINLNEHEEYYKSTKNCKADEHLKHLFEEIMVLHGYENKELTRAVFQTFLNQHKILILLDGFDEIATLYADVVTNIAKCFQNEGYHMWITTRPVTKMHLEQTFNTFSVDLKPFTPADQKDYLKKYLTLVEEDRHNILDRFVEDLLEAAKSNLFDYDYEFTGVPLQTQLLADVFAKEYRNSLTCAEVTFNKKFDLLYLYDEFFKIKINILCKKFGEDAGRTKVLFEEHQQLFSLKTVFKKEHLQELKIEDKLDQYCQDKRHEKEMQFLQREGVVVPNQTSTGTQFKFNVNFIHNTFAEFLAGKWLAENFISEDENVKTTIRLLVNCRFKLFEYNQFIYIIFDRIVTRDCKSHLALINGKLDEINLADINEKDASGRTLLQIMATKGCYHSGAYYNAMQKVDDKIAKLFEKVPKEQITDEKDTILGYNVLDYALARDSLAVANRICEKTEIPLNIDLSIVKANRYFTYCVVLEYQALFNVLVLYFASRGMLIWNKHKDSAIESYCKLVKEETRGTENFFKYIDSFGVAAISELFKFKYKDPESPFGNYYYDLRFATVYGSVDNINLLVAQGFDLNQQDVDRNTPLYYAASRKRLDAVTIYLNNGAEVNKTGCDGNTALHIAAKSGDTGMVEELLVYGADINKYNDKNETALHLALSGGYLRTVNLLLLNGARVDIETKTGDTALHFAAKQDYDENIATILTKHFKLLDKQNIFGNTALHVATIYNKYNAVRTLLGQGVDCNIQNNKGNSALHCAVLEDDEYVIKELLVRSQIDLQNNDGETPLHLASSRHLETTKLLLYEGANCNIKNNKCYTPLHNAIIQGKADIVSELLKAGADVNAVDWSNSTPLHTSTAYRHDNISKLLLDYDADIHIKSNNMVTCLHYACIGGSLEIVSILLSKCADINATTLYKFTPLHQALAHGHHEVAQLLVSKGADCKTENSSGHTPLHAAAMTGADTIIPYLLDNGLDVNKQTREGDTPLHFAALKGHYDAAKILVENSANTNIQNILGRTPLHVCLYNVHYYKGEFYERHRLTVKLLMDNGAELHIREEDGNTPLHIACKFQADPCTFPPIAIEDCHNFYNDVVQMCLQQCADINLKNSEGETALELAEQNGHESLVRILKEHVKSIE